MPSHMPEESAIRDGDAPDIAGSPLTRLRKREEQVQKREEALEKQQLELVDELQVHTYRKRFLVEREMEMAGVERQLQERVREQELRAAQTRTGDAAVQTEAALPQDRAKAEPRRGCRRTCCGRRSRDLEVAGAYTGTDDHTLPSVNGRHSDSKGIGKEKGHLEDADEGCREPGEEQGDEEELTRLPWEGEEDLASVDGDNHDSDGGKKEHACLPWEDDEDESEEEEEEDNCGHGRNRCVSDGERAQESAGLPWEEEDDVAGAEEDENDAHEDRQGQPTVFRRRGRCGVWSRLFLNTVVVQGTLGVFFHFVAPAGTPGAPPAPPSRRARRRLSRGGLAAGASGQVCTMADAWAVASLQPSDEFGGLAATHGKAPPVPSARRTGSGDSRDARVAPEMLPLGVGGLGQDATARLVSEPAQRPGGHIKACFWAFALSLWTLWVAVWSIAVWRCLALW